MAPNDNVREGEKCVFAPSNDPSGSFNIDTFLYRFPKYINKMYTNTDRLAPSPSTNRKIRWGWGYNLVDARAATRGRCVANPGR